MCEADKIDEERIKEIDEKSSKIKKSLERKNDTGILKAIKKGKSKQVK